MKGNKGNTKGLQRKQRKGVGNMKAICKRYEGNMEEIYRTWMHRYLDVHSVILEGVGPGPGRGGRRALTDYYF